MSAGANEAALARAERREARGLFLLCSPAVLLIGLVIFLPIGWLFALSFQNEQGAFTLDHYARMLHPAYTRSFQTTLELSFLVTGICCLLGYPLAYLMSQVPKAWRAIIFVCVLFPFWTSLLVRTYAWLVLLQRRGVVNSWLQDLGLVDQPLRLVHNFTGTAIGMTQIMLPFMVLPLYAAMTAVDRDYVKAASSLGASPIRSFWQVFFPLTLPGLLAGIVLVFVLCLGFYVTPAVLGGGRVLMWSMSIERSVAVYSDWGAASALGVVLLVVTLGILWIMNRLFGVGQAIGGR
ncbi:ABC transporter permease [Stella sp.]|uniref:ABC transporter permease n=1 Tax=Stella sp. TaxID=2912054 RepID=UPI0035AF4A36